MPIRRFLPAIAALLAGAAPVQSGNPLVQQGARPIGPATPHGRVALPTGRPPVFTGDLTPPQQKPPIHFIQLTYVLADGGGWMPQIEVAGDLWTQTDCHGDVGVPTKQYDTAIACDIVPKAQTVHLQVKLVGIGKNNGKMSAIGGGQWGGDCAGQSGIVCTLDMSANRVVPVSLPKA